MFITSADFHVPAPASLMPKEGRCSSAVTLSADLPWFLLSVLRPAQRSEIAVTTLVAWPQTLVELLEDERVGRAVSIRWMRPRVGKPGWEALDLTEVWRPTDREEIELGPILVRVAGETILRNEFCVPAGDLVPGRRLLARFES